MASFERPEDANLTPEVRDAAVAACRAEYFSELGRRSVEARQRAAEALAERTTREQGLPIRISDLGTLDVIAVVLFGKAADDAA
jgi:hypothetical protein